ncbi:putative aldo/keto reductase-like oxidoreductase [Methanomicrobium sp. W14]|uniref:aldo/keto reductase n=1 Tax=Methanomicrobium sp. W14 TaxID=2817839 RepID=UPI001AE9ACF9|nr:aldo/keto reductase [Methanomicrobium sp. W14]MBP2133963.1 putative aldo/keto reductase-like oxidoreductase [Methanomicrobium sp. W14]
MLYRKVPKNGDELSILGFGCMRLPVKEDGTIDEERAKRQVRYAIDNGVNYVDTAWPYHNGGSEPFLGRALADGYREKVKLATKLPSWLIEEREDMDRFLDAQLKKLNTSHIDYYLVHALVGDLWDKVKNLGVADFLDRAKADGRIVNAGFSFHGASGDFRRIVDAYEWDFCQIQYNYLDEKNQAGTKGLEYAASKGLAVIVMEPLRGGNLTKTVPEVVKEIWDEAPVKRTPAEWALRWVWNHPEVTVVLSGMGDEEEVRENLLVADEGYPDSLSGAELDIIKEVEGKYRELMKVGCTGCHYCMPCPSGVNIPGCFEQYNNISLTGDPENAKFVYAAQQGGVLSVGEPEYASLCIQCGECVGKCPQHIDIPAVLESVVKEMEGPDFEERIAAAREIFKKK